MFKAKIFIICSLIFSLLASDLQGMPSACSSGLAQKSTGGKVGYAQLSGNKRPHAQELVEPAGKKLKQEDDENEEQDSENGEEEQDDEKDAPASDEDETSEINKDKTESEESKHEKSQYNKKKTETTSDAKNKLTPIRRRIFSCSFCHNKSRGITNFNRHMKIHTLKHEFKCAECVASFQTKRGLINHAIAHAESKGLKLEKQQPPKCLECDFVAPNSALLIKHMKVHTPSPDKKVKCTICPSYFKSTRGLFQHMIMHEKHPPRPNTHSSNDTQTTSSSSAEQNVIAASAALLNGSGAAEPQESPISKKPKVKINAVATNSVQAKAEAKPAVSKQTKGKKSKPTVARPALSTIIDGDTILYICDQCQKPFDRESKLKTHRQQEHPAASEDAASSSSSSVQTAQQSKHADEQSEAHAKRTNEVCAAQLYTATNNALLAEIAAQKMDTTSAKDFSAAASDGSGAAPMPESTPYSAAVAASATLGAVASTLSSALSTNTALPIVASAAMAQMEQKPNALLCPTCHAPIITQDDINRHMSGQHNSAFNANFSDKICEYCNGLCPQDSVLVDHLNQCPAYKAKYNQRRSFSIALLDSDAMLPLSPTALPKFDNSAPALQKDLAPAWWEDLAPSGLPYAQTALAQANSAAAPASIASAASSYPKPYALPSATTEASSRTLLGFAAGDGDGSNS